MEYPETVVISKAENLIREKGIFDARQSCEDNINYFELRAKESNCDKVITKSNELKCYWEKVLNKILNRSI